MPEVLSRILSEKEVEIKVINWHNEIIKKLTCRNFGGPCDAVVTGNSFQEAGKMCHDHVMEQINSGDEAHKIAADNMRNASPEEQKSMMAEYERKYNEAPEV